MMFASAEQPYLLVLSAAFFLSVPDADRHAIKAQLVKCCVLHGYLDP